MSKHQMPVRAERSGSAIDIRTPFHGLRDEIDRVFEDFLSWSPFQGGQMAKMASGRSPADYIEREKEYEIDLDVPGVKKENIEVTLSDHSLTVRGNVAEEREEKGEHFHRCERLHQSFSRTFELPTGVDSSKVAADLKEGVLRIVLPKTAEVLQNTRKIEIH